MRPHNDRRRSPRLLRRSIAAVTVAAICLATAAAGIAAPDPERHSTALTGWGWYRTVTETELNDFIDDFDMRLADIEVIDPGQSKFAGTLVHNSGTYHRPSWHWYFGLTFNELVNHVTITSGRERPLDVENYIRNGRRRYAFVTTSNQDEYEKGWWWYFNVSKTFIKNHLTGRRIIDLDRRPNSSKYDVVMIANTGEDKKGLVVLLLPHATADQRSDQGQEGPPRRHRARRGRQVHDRDGPALR